MNFFKLACTAGVLTLALTGAIGCTPGQKAGNTTNTTDGTIILREGNGSTECSLTATVGDHSFRSHSCKSDQYYEVRFENIPSARNITFFDDATSDSCADNEGWEFEVRTIKNPTTTNYMNLAGMYKVAPNTIILPGVLKIRHTDIDDQIYGKLTCIRVEDDKKEELFQD
ncbi:TPA: hypothetical protein SAN82_001855 [Pseudomonas putida]|nr:hypothetical protein [Pseudomonas putida]